jgi:hypothetical protein
LPAACAAAGHARASAVVLAARGLQPPVALTGEELPADVMNQRSCGHQRRSSPVTNGGRATQYHLPRTAVVRVSPVLGRLRLGGCDHGGRCRALQPAAGHRHTAGAHYRPQGEGQAAACEVAWLHGSKPPGAGSRDTQPLEIRGGAPPALLFADCAPSLSELHRQRLPTTGTDLPLPLPGRAHETVRVRVHEYQPRIKPAEPQPASKGVAR